jgi:hypothetical protein
MIKRASHETDVLCSAVGCSDLIPPEDSWLKRTDNEAIVGCFTSRQTWHLKCKDRRWIGVVSNCTSCTKFVNLLKMKYNAYILLNSTLFSLLFGHWL